VSNEFWFIFAPVVITAILAGALVWLQYKILVELREGREQRGQFQNQVLDASQKLKTAFHDADGSFKHLIDTLQGVGNLQQIKERVNYISANLVDEHQKISSQIGISGRIVEELHKLVAQWSNEGSELQRAYHALADTIREEIFREAAQRDKFSIQLETLIQQSTIGKAADGSK
jgi:type I site-specific restriction-modification system R (restriction) subunit